ncbi:c-type cytochrome [Sphingosinicellaceae bacterium]|nr:c-type cytochrome [Sphingosinicellaceae bacterium]
MATLSRRSSRTWLWILLAIIVVAAFMAWNLTRDRALPAQRMTSVAAARILTQPITDTVPNAAQLRRGQYLVRVGDCLSCHLRAGGEAFAGGLGLNTPFGVIYTSNITSDRETGIGNWTGDQFYGAMRHGVDDTGANLYPAFPYPWFTKVSRADDDAILAYLKSTAPVRYTPPTNDLPFPLNIRLAVSGWNLLFFKEAAFKPEPARSPEWNRGAEIVGGLGHCGGCHTPKNLLGADKSGQEFHGGALENTFAPDLTSNPRTGLANWSVDDIAEYLHTGRNARAAAGSTMAEVITYSTSVMSEPDLRAIATYLKALPPSPSTTATAPDAGAMQRGAAIYSDACSACHLENGVGQPRYFPPLGQNAMLQQRDPVGLVRLILAGARVGPSPSRPSPMAMPSFAWKLTDAEVADVATFIRNSWGNQADPIAATAVKSLRGKLGLDTLRLTDNSGDHLQR